MRWQAEGRWGEADIRGLQSASCSQMTLGCLNQSGVVQVQPRLPIRLTELPGASRVAGLARAELSPLSNPPTTVPNGGQHAKSCHRLYSATASLRSNHSLAAGKSTRQSRIKADNELHTLVISSRVDGGGRELRPGYACSRVMPRVLCGMPAPRVGGRDSSAAVTPVPVSQPVGAHPSARPHVHSSCEQPVLWCDSVFRECSK